MPIPFEYESVISIPQFSDCPSKPKNQTNSDFLSTRFLFKKRMNSVCRIHY